MRCSDVPAEISRAAAAVSTSASRRPAIAAGGGGHPQEHPFGFAPAGARRFDGGGDRGRELFEQAADRSGRVAGTPGEAPDLLGDLAEAPPDVACLAGGLDRGVERQQVGFARDVLDQREDAEDLLGAAFEVGGALGDRRDALAQALDAGHRAADGGGALVAGRLAEPRELRLRLRVAGDLGGGLRQLFHGGGDLDHRSRLLGGAGGQLRGDPS